MFDNLYENSTNVIVSIISSRNPIQKRKKIQYIFLSAWKKENRIIKVECYYRVFHISRCINQCIFSLKVRTKKKERNDVIYQLYKHARKLIYMYVILYLWILRVICVRRRGHRKGKCRNKRGLRGMCTSFIYRNIRGKRLLRFEFVCTYVRGNSVIIDVPTYSVEKKKKIVLEPRGRSVIFFFVLRARISFIFFNNKFSCEIKK